MFGRYYQSTSTSMEYLITVMCFGLIWSTKADIQTDDMTLEDALMERYSVSNAEQCRRLCWYRKLCTGYSHTDKGHTGLECSLYADPWRESALASGITWNEATKDNIQHSCADRPCAETEVCVPATSSNQQHRCLPLVSDCGVPAPVKNGSFDWSGIRQGHVATLTCDTGFVPFPEETSGQLTCHVTSQWRPLGISCKKLPCDNGGLHNSRQCICPVQHAGDRCERYIRDCTEAFRNGHDNRELSGPYYIQPNTSPDPFLVYCRFEWGGITIPFRRTHPSSTRYNVDWTTVKAGFTTTLTSDLSTADFFSGLENLHHLVSQSFYRLHMSLGRPGEDNAYTGVFYENFALGNESTNYTLTYHNYWSRQVDITVNADDGFHASPPVTFHTQDRDTKGCAGMRGAAGWYGADCNGYTLFSDDVLVWPAGGVAQNWTIVDMVLERHGEFYEDL